MAKLKTENFTLEIEFYSVSEVNKTNAIDTAITVLMSVSCYDYAGKTQIFCREEERRNFVKNLSEIYESLKEGITAIYDYEPEQNYLSIKSDGLGHFIVSGIFNNWGNWTLKFEECIDQTYFKSFIKQLNEELN